MTDAKPGRLKIPRGLHFLRIINSRFQLTVLGIFLLYVAEIVFMALWSTSSAVAEIKTVMTDGGVAPTFDLLQQIYWHHTNSFLRGCGLITIIHCLIWMVVSNRVAGPLFRLQNELDRYTEGETVGNLAFRKEDYFRGLAKSVQSAIKVGRSNEGSEGEKK